MKLFLECVLRQCETHSVCLSCSTERVTETISLTLHSVSHVFYIALMQIKKIKSFNKKNNHFSPLDIYKGLNNLQTLSGPFHHSYT